MTNKMELPVHESNTVLNKDGSLSYNANWYTTAPVEINGCDFIRITGTINTMPESDTYANVIFVSEPYVYKDHFVSYYTLLNERGNHVIDAYVPIPTGAKYFAFSNASEHESTVTFYKYEKPLTRSEYKNVKNDIVPFLMQDYSENVLINNVNVRYNDGNVYFTGELSENKNVLIYSSKSDFVLERGCDYLINFIPPSGVSTIYLQICNNRTSNVLVSSTKIENLRITIPDDAENVLVRFILFTGSYSSVGCEFAIKKIEKEYWDYHINSALKLYNFMKAPKRFTRLILEPGTYDLYTGLFENDIANGDTFGNGIDLYMRDVEIIGNGSTLTMIIPKEVIENDPHPAGSKIVNTYSILNVVGNFRAENLIMKAKNARYVLHYECLEDRSAFDTTQEFVGCTFDYDCDISAGLNANAVGIGGSRGQHFIFKNCEFKTEWTKANIYIHTRLYNIAEFRLENCNVKKGYPPIQLSQYTGNGLAIPVNIVNSIVVGTSANSNSIVYFTQTNGNSDNQFAVKAINSYIPNIARDNSCSSVLYKPQRINTITGEIDTSYNNAET